eukprot:1554960-Rhodomonas_salina.2
MQKKLVLTTVSGGSAVSLERAWKGIPLGDGAAHSRSLSLLAVWATSGREWNWRARARRLFAREV